jgi:hypothetical protein
LPLAPADRFPVNLENASRTRPANLSTVPSPLSRDPDFIAAYSSSVDALANPLAPAGVAGGVRSPSMRRRQTSRRRRLPTPCRTPRSNPKTPAKRPPSARPRPRRTPISLPLELRDLVPEPSRRTPEDPSSGEMSAAALCAAPSCCTETASRRTAQAASLICGISTSSSPSSVCTLRGRKPLRRPALIVRPALIARPAQPGVELVLDRALDDRPRPQFREVRERLPRVLTDPHGQQLVDLLLNLRRRRYGTSHGVGPPSRLAGHEGTYAVPLTGPAIYSTPETRPRRRSCYFFHVVATPLPATLDAVESLRVTFLAARADSCLPGPRHRLAVSK